MPGAGRRIVLRGGASGHPGAQAAADFSADALGVTARLFPEPQRPLRDGILLATLPTLSPALASRIRATTPRKSLPFRAGANIEIMVAVFMAVSRRCWERGARGPLALRGWPP